MKPVALRTIETPGADFLERSSQVGDQGFDQAISKAISQVEKLQTEGDTEAAKLGGGEGNLHETMLALEKADIGMRVALKVRNKVVEAYNEIMRMSV